MGFFTGEFTENGYRPSRLFNLLRPTVSGNKLNGLGEDTPRPRIPLHMHNRTRRHPWTAVQEWFYLREARDLVGMRDILAMNRLRKKLDKHASSAQPNGPVEIRRSPEQWTELARDYALTHTTAEVFGVTALTNDLVFDVKVDEFDLSDRWIIVIAQRMDYAMLSAAASSEPANTPFLKSKFTRSARTVYRTYRETFHSAVRLAEWIRSQGFKATAHGGATPGPISYIPAAIRAGLGELGKHGSLINPDIGSGIRLAVVLTSMPLIPNREQRYGIDEFCQRCQACSRACPGNALSNQKQMIRGISRWYVDFDSCIPVFAERRGCAICLAVCPWTRPGVPMKLAQKMLRRIQGAPAGNA
jgi:epoxyqueuosine reductase